MEKEEMTRSFRLLKQLVKVFLLGILTVVLSYSLAPYPTIQALDSALNYLDGGKEYNSKVSYLNGIHKPVENEIDEVPIELEVVSGRIPEDIDGVYLRIGPNELVDNPNRGQMTYHLFDGHGFINVFALSGRDQKATYTRSWVKNPRFNIEKEKGVDVFGRLGTLVLPYLPFRMLLQHLKLKIFNLTDLTSGPANTAMWLMQGRLFALNEGSLPFEIALNEVDNGYVLQSLGYEDFGGKLNVAMTAHPRKDAQSGSTVFASYSPPDGVFAVGEIDSNELVSLQTIPPRLENKVGWAHDCALTNNFVVIPDGGMHFSLEGMAKGIFFETISTLGLTIVPRNYAGNTNLTEHQPFSVTADTQETIVHIATAWEEEDEIVVATPLSSTLKGVAANKDTVLEGPETFDFAKLRISTKAGASAKIKVEKIPFSKCNPEFPRVNPLMDGGKKVRFAYASCLYSLEEIDRAGVLNCIGFAKYDLETMSVANHVRLPDDWQIGELVPIPKNQPGENISDSDGSDKVWLIGITLHVKTSESRIVIYDGETMDSEPVVSLRSSERIPLGFHGQFYQRDFLEKEGHFLRQKQSMKQNLNAGTSAF